jgi:hypothetical protein
VSCGRCCGSCGLGLGRGWFSFPHQLFYAGDVFGDVDADGVVRDFGGADTPAIFEPAELFELLGFFQFALGKGGIFEQGIALEGIETEVLPIGDVELLLGIANPGNGRAGEIEGVVVEVENGFDHVGIHDVCRMSNHGHDGGDLGGRIVEEGAHSGVDGEWVDEGLVALNIDENVPRFVDGDFGDPLGARAVVGAGHAGQPAKGLDGIENPLVVRSYQYFVDGLALS